MKDNILNEVRELARTYPNNYELGQQIRNFISNKDDGWRITQFNRNRAIEDKVSPVTELDKKIDEIYNNYII